MHGPNCPCIVFSSAFPSRGPLLRPDTGSEIFSRQTPHDSPQTRRTERKFRMPPRLSGSSFRNTGNERERPYRPPQPAESDGCTNRKNPLSPHSVSFRPSRLPTSGTLRNRTFPRLSPRHASPPWGRPRSARFFTCGNTSPNETQRRDTSRNEKSPRPKPLRTASYRYGGRPPQSDVAPPSGSAADRRKSRKRPPPPPRRIRPQDERRTLRDARPGQEAYGGETRPSSAARIPSKDDSISRHAERTYLPLRPMSFAAAASGPARAAAESGSSPETRPAVAHPGIRIRKMQSDTSIHRSIYFPSSPCDGFVSSYSYSVTIRRGEFGGHPVNG